MTAGSVPRAGREHSCSLASTKPMKSLSARLCCRVAFVALLVTTAVLFAQAAPIGLKTTLTQRGIDYANQVGLEILRQQLGRIQVPNIHGDAGTPVGSITYDLTNIVVTNVNIPATQIQIVPGKGVDVSVSGVGAHCTLNWSYREDSWPHISDSGSADIDVHDLSVTVAVGEQGGRPTVSTAACSVNVGGLNIDLHGGASWLYNLFVGLFSGQIQSGIQGALHDAIVQAINQQAEQALATIPIEEPIDSVSEVNFELVTAPEFTATYLTTQHLGEFYARRNPSEAPFPTAPMPDELSADMLQVLVSDFVLNSAGFVYTNAGKLTATVNPDDVPSWSPVHLNTTDFKILVPELYATFPNMGMQLVIAAAPYPKATFTSTGVTIAFPGTITVNVLNGTQPVPAFVIAINGLTSANASISGTNLVGTLSFLNATLSLQSSQIGPVQVSVLQDLVNLMCSAGIVPLLNTYAAKGFPLPVVQGLTFVNPAIVFGDGFLGVATDVVYKP